MKYNRPFSIAFCLLAFLAATLIARYVLEGVPHLEDEIAYWFQAQVFADGRLYTPSPETPFCFSTHFVVDYGGRRFGKYPPGWPALLALGMKLGVPWWINAAGALLTVALTFRLARELDGPTTGAWAAALAATSPFVLLLSGSLMPHTTCLVFVTAFLWSFIRSCRAGQGGSRWAALAGLMLGGAFAIRPFSAVAVAALAGATALWRGLRRREWARVPALAGGFALLAWVVPFCNAAWTGNPWLSPYTLVWPFDQVGFGPGHGPFPQGNTVWSGLGNVGAAWLQMPFHLHGWPGLSLLFVIVPFILHPRRFWDGFLGMTTLSLSLAHVAYWTSGSTFGPRYLYEGTSALLALSARGLRLAGAWMQAHSSRARRVFRGALLLLITFDLVIYLPWQLARYHDLYGITAAPRRILEQANLHHALVIVRETREWKDYAVPFAMNAPTLDGDVVYARSCPFTDTLRAAYPDRAVYEFDGQTVYPSLSSHTPIHSQKGVP
ncbi:MAG TPA: glycosyltransferase family 39 protein [Anaerolineae bacterium]|nr:glycosyltransferase family 39 protein [Anaerolineae bacterium]